MGKEKDWEFYEEDNLNHQEEPDYYYCTCCNNTQTKLGFGHSCDSCGMFNVMEEGHF